MKNLFSVEGKIALVTGGSRGIGLMIARGFVENGACVYVASRKAEECEKVAKDLSKFGDCHGIAADLSTQDGAKKLADEVGKRTSKLDVLVNNAGANWGAPMAEYPDAAWHKVMDLNINALFFLTREVGRRAMIPRQSGRIINIASIAGLGGNPGGIHTIAYNTSKGAVVNFTRALATEWGPQGINVNAICPGFFPSKMSQGLLDVIEPQVIAATPLRRLGGDEDLQGAVVYLASAASRHVTGQCLAVDGGMSVVI